MKRSLLIAVIILSLACKKETKEYEITLSQAEQEQFNSIIVGTWENHLSSTDLITHFVFKPDFTLSLYMYGTSGGITFPEDGMLVKENLPYFIKSARIDADWAVGKTVFALYNDYDIIYAPICIISPMLFYWCQNNNGEWAYTEYKKVN